MAKPRLIAGVDVGCTKICTIIGEVGSDGRPRRVELSATPGTGMERGAVVDRRAADAAISRALDEAQGTAQRRIESVLIGTSAAVRSLNNRGTTTLGQARRAVTAEDVRRAVGVATDAGLPGSRQVLQAIPRGFAVDGQSEPGSPVGVLGRRIDAEVHVVTAAEPTIRALTACIESWGAEVEEIIAQPLAAAKAVLTTEEREVGVAVADLGAGCAGLSIFVDGKPWHTATVPVGGRHVTQDLATVLGISVDVAEELKLAAGHACAEAVDPRETLEIAPLDGEGRFQLTQRELCEIIEARARELIGLVGAEIRRSGYGGLLPGGLVLTGGMAQLPGIARVASEMLQLRVRIGQPEAVGEMGRGGPAQASAVGLLLWALDPPTGRRWAYPPSAAQTAEARQKRPAVERWLRARWPAVLGGKRKG